MERTRFIEHQGQPIVLLDLAGIKEEAELLAEVENARNFFATRIPDGSLRTLTHTTGSAYSRAAVDALRDLTAQNREYVRAAAVVTDSQLHRMVISTLALVVRRKMQAFEDLETAKDWLVQQYAARRILRAFPRHRSSATLPPCGAASRGWPGSRNPIASPSRPPFPTRWLSWRGTRRCTAARTWWWPTSSSPATSTPGGG